MPQTFYFYAVICLTGNPLQITNLDVFQTVNCNFQHSAARTALKVKYSCYDFSHLVFEEGSRNFPSENPAAVNLQVALWPAANAAIWWPEASVRMNTMLVFSDGDWL